MGKKIKKHDNFLELIPIRRESQKWEINEQGLVQIIIPRSGILDKIVRMFFKTPKVTRIDLDSIGSSVWNDVDGKRSVGEIGENLRNKFGEDAEPLYERLGTYINILRNNKFIILEKARD